MLNALSEYVNKVNMAITGVGYKAPIVDALSFVHACLFPVGITIAPESFPHHTAYWTQALIAGT